VTASETATKGANGVIVELDQVVKEYHLGAVVVPAIREVSLTIRAGEFASIAGPSGSGKTTLLNLIGCVDVATSGRVTVAGRTTNELSDRALTKLRLFNIGFIFQSFNLVAVLSAFQNVEFPLLLQKRVSKAERRERVERLLQLVGLGDHGHHRPGDAIIELMKRINEQQGTTFIFSTHDQKVIDCADRVVGLVDGRIAG
jgi:putative ABC transport system ATP-binding protein